MKLQLSYIYVLLLILVGCDVQPEVGEFRQPEIKGLKVAVDVNDVEFVAELASPPAPKYEYGFCYGTSQENMKMVRARSSGRTFSARVQSLDYETEYIYKAYVSNSRNRITSQEGTFTTMPEPYRQLEDDAGTIPSEGAVLDVEVSSNIDFEVLIPAGTDWLSYTKKGNIVTFEALENRKLEQRACSVEFREPSGRVVARKLSLIQEKSSYDLIVPFLSRNVDFKGETFDLNLKGKADFEVLIPEEVDWIQCQRNERKCSFSVAYNGLKTSRQCEICFNSLDSEYRKILTVIQEGHDCGLEISYDSLECGPEESQHTVVISSNHNYKYFIRNGEDWVDVISDKDGTLEFKVLNNKAEVPRSCSIVFECEVCGDTRSLEITQQKQTYELYVHVNETTVSGIMTYPYDIRVEGNVRYEVLIPEDVQWVWLDHTNKKYFWLGIKRNGTEESRSCEIVVSSLDHDCRHIVRIHQQHVPVSVLDFPQEGGILYYETPFASHETDGCVDENGKSVSSGWLVALSFGDDRIMLQAEENTGDTVRVARVWLRDGITDDSSDNIMLLSVRQSPSRSGTE